MVTSNLPSPSPIVPEAVDGALRQVQERSGSALERAIVDEVLEVPFEHVDVLILVAMEISTNTSGDASHFGRRHHTFRWIRCDPSSEAEGRESKAHG